MYTYKTEGTCSESIHIETQDGVITNVRFDNGCSGNLEGIARLVVGMRVEEAAERLKGIQCQNGTSCPDQLSRALTRMPPG